MRGAKSLSVGLVILVAATVAASAQAATARPCATPCRDSVHATEAVKRWTSPVEFSAEAGVTAVGVVLRVNGNRLDGRWRGCRGEYSGQGVSALIRTCGRTTPIRIRYVSLRGTRRVAIVYRGFYE